jgi:hypothetical protein
LLDGFIVYLGEAVYCPHILPEKGKKKVNVTSISRNGVVCKSLLGDQVVEKEFFCREKFTGKWLAGDGDYLY